MSGSKLLDGIAFVCSICQYFISGSKRLDRITLYVQLVSTSYLVQNLDGITLYVRDVQIHETSGGPDYFLPDLKFLSWKPTNEIYIGKKVLFFQYVKCPIRISAKQLAIWQTIHFHVDIRFQFENKTAINLNEKFISCLWIVNGHDKSIFHCQISSEPLPIPILWSRCHVRCKSNEIGPFCWKISVRHQVHRWLTISLTLIKSAPSVRQVRQFWTSPHHSVEENLSSI